ncbi:MAG: hypothetical protein KatS3mg023_2998 [Armatimonadota bacterium]|nr:MAG: hypothetical protein KatS3mg023_2998 [Armatimonadota bacterium]
MQSVGWLVAAVMGAITYVMRTVLVVALNGALYQIWTVPPPPEPPIERLSPLQEMQMSLLTWWYETPLTGWLQLVLMGAALGILLRIRCQRKEHPLLGSNWLLLVTAFLILWVDYPPALMVQVPQGIIAAGGFLLLLVLVFALNVVWVGLLEQSITVLDRRIPEWLV